MKMLDGIEDELIKEILTFFVLKSVSARQFFQFNTLEAYYQNFFFLNQMHKIMTMAKLIAIKIA